MGRGGVSLSTVLSRAPDGLTAPLVRVEVHLAEGIPAFFIVGLPEAVVRESKERVRSAVARRVLGARARQLARQGKLNCRLTARDVGVHCRLDRASKGLLGAAIARLGLSARACERVLKLARSCADLGGSEAIGAAHLSEAITLRALDRAQPGC